MTAAIHEDTEISLARGVRLQWEPAQNVQVLLFPEGMVQLNGPAGDILALCDGRSMAAIVAELETSFGASELRADVLEFLQEARRRGWIHWLDGADAASDEARHGTG